MTTTLHTIDPLMTAVFISVPVAMHSSPAKRSVLVAALLVPVLFAIGPAALTAQHQHPHEGNRTGMHEMWMQPLGGGWQLAGMGQIFPLNTWSAAFEDDHPLSGSDLYFTQPAVMANIESTESGIVLRTTLSFEGLTIPDGERTFGSWGEGFIDSRHPHTILHEAMISFKVGKAGGGALSLSAGKGFAAFGTEDPMTRPVQKFPTNHHLSQILERFQVQAGYLAGGWGVEASLFGGEEPAGPYDFSNIESFADSWSVRISRRFGRGFGPFAHLEASASVARVMEHEDDLVNLYNVALRHAGGHGPVDLYGLIEASMSAPEQRDGFFAVLGETRLQRGRHRPYYRIEYSTRPEYEREGVAGTDDFFRYDHDDRPAGATRWLIQSLGYGHTLTGYPASIRPFIELQHHWLWHERGQAPEELFENGSFWSISAGFRMFFGGEMMRMGGYGWFDPMTLMHRPAPEANGHPPDRDHH